MISSLLDKYPEMGLLNVFLFEIFWGTVILLSIAVVQIYIPVDSAQRFPFSTSLPAFIVSCFFLVIAVLTSVRWYFIVLWLAFLWWIVMLNTFSCTFWPFLCLWTLQFLCPLLNRLFGNTIINGEHFQNVDVRTFTGPSFQWNHYN